MNAPPRLKPAKLVTDDDVNAACDRIKRDLHLVFRMGGIGAVMRVTRWNIERLAKLHRSGDDGWIT